jgi:hypothetical protein
MEIGCFSKLFFRHNSVAKKFKGISVTEYAKREGISRKAAYDRFASGKVTRLDDGSIDPKTAKRQWDKNRDDLQSQRGAHSGKKNAAPRPEEDQGATSLGQLQRAEKALKIKRDQMNDFAGAHGAAEHWR